MSSDSQDDLKEDSLITELQEILGIVDREYLINILEENSWDVYSAIDCHFSSNSLRGDTDTDINSNQKQEINEKPTGIVSYYFDKSKQLGKYIFSILYCSFHWIFSWVFTLSGLNLFFASKNTEPNNMSSLVDLETSYGKSHPTFFSGSFSELISQMKALKSPAICFLHKNACEISRNSYRNIIFTEEVTRNVDKNFLFWLCDLNTRDAAELCQMLQSSFRSPHFVFLTNPNKMDLDFYVLKAANIGKEIFIERASNILAKVKLAETKLAAEREKLINDRNLKKFQDEEYERMLKIDRERRQKVLEMMRIEEKILMKKREKELKGIRISELLNSLKAQMVKRSNDQISGSVVKNDTLTVALKYPNGSVVIYKYPKETGTIKDLADDILGSNRVPTEKSKYNIYRACNVQEQELLCIDFEQYDNLSTKYLKEYQMNSTMLLLEPCSSSDSDENDEINVNVKQL